VTANNFIIERQDLLHTFNELKNNRTIAIRAPAGYGKTVAINQWLEKDTRAKAIFSLDEYDNSLAGFCERFCAALTTCQPQNKTLSEIISHHSFQSAPDEFTLRAVSALFDGNPAVLAIDDLHLLHNDGIVRLLNTLIKRLPNCFQIILASRHDLPACLSELWIKGLVAELNVEQFIFSNDEVKALYSKRSSPITLEQAEAINRQAGGWAIGINAFLLSGGKTFHKANDYLDDFIRANIWDKWDGATRDFLIRTAFLRELEPSKCEAMTSISHSVKVLKKLVQQGAFITQLHDGTYRYHHLFQQFLMRKAEERGEGFLFYLLETEGHWYISQEDFYSAIDCFIRCKNLEGIAKCYGLLEVSGRENFSLSKLLPIVKHQEFQNAAKQYPSMLFIMVCCAFAEGRVADMTSYMDMFYANFPDLTYKILYVHSYDFRLPLNQVLSEFEALSTTQTSSTLEWTVSMHMPLLYRGIKDYSEIALGDVVERSIVEYPKFKWILGEEACMHNETIVSGLLYEQGKLEKAYEHAVKAMAEIKSHFMIEANFCAMANMVCVLDAINKNDLTAADEIMLSILHLIEETKSYHLAPNLKAINTRRAISTGDIKAIENWLIDQDVNNPTLYGIYIAITTSRALICTGKYDSAIVLLNKVLGVAKSFNRPLDTIEAHILLAIAYWKKSKFQNEALGHLESAVSIAFPYSYMQMFVNDGVALSGMLYKLQRRVEQRNGDGRKHIEFIKLLYALTRSTNTDSVYEPSGKSMKFTDKQMDVINLLVQGKHQREIADILGIKFISLRSRLSLIYNKLGVTNVTDAIAKIKAMRLLD